MEKILEASHVAASQAQENGRTYGMSQAEKLFMKTASVFLFVLGIAGLTILLGDHPLRQKVLLVALSLFPLGSGVWGWTIADRIVTILRPESISCRYYFRLRTFERRGIKGYRVFLKRTTYEIKVYSKTNGQPPLSSFPYGADAYYRNWFSKLSNLGDIDLPKV